MLSTLNLAPQIKNEITKLSVVATNVYFSFLDKAGLCRETDSSEDYISLLAECFQLSARMGGDCQDSGQEVVLAVVIADSYQTRLEPLTRYQAVLDSGLW